jgi:hypothetical protein
MEPFIARSPVDLLAVVPYAIGFHPEDSVVLLAFGSRQPGQVLRFGESFHARVDLPVVEHQQREIAQVLRDVVRRHRIGMVGLVLYTDDVAAATLFADLLVPDLIRAGVVIVDVIRVADDRFFAVNDPDDPGTPYDLSTHPFTAEQVVSGRVVHENRAALMDSLIGTDDEDAAAVAAVADSMVDELLAAGHETAGQKGALGELLVGEARWVQRVVRRYLRSPRPLTAAVAGRLLVLVSFEAIREVAWAEMRRADSRRHVELWRDLTRRAPADLRTGAGGLLAFASWLAGDGAMACCALERCFGEDPDDSLAQHVVSLIESATPPSVWSPIPQSALRVFRLEAGTAAS